MNCPVRLLLLLVTIFLTTNGALAAEISLAPAGDGRFSVNGTAMNGVAGIKLTITYDSNLLSAPVVSQGGLIAGAMLAVNTNVPGMITVGAVNTVPFGSSGQIVALSFTSKGGSGGITNLQVLELIDVKGAALPAKVSLLTETASSSGTISNPFSGFSQSQTTGQQQTATTAGTPTASTAATATSSAATPSIGSITLPGEEKQAAAVPAQTPQEPRQQEQYQPPPATGNRAEESAVTARPAKEKQRGEIVKNRYPAVLDRFKEFKGERQLPALTALFSAPVADEAKQEPTLAISDGKQTVRITAGFAAPDDAAAPNFAASEARIVALKPEESSGSWRIDLLPTQGAVTASISILRGDKLFEVPLTLVPPAGKLTFSADEIRAFLKDYAAAKPLFDLDGNGKHDYIDDYIYSGHYLLRGKASNLPKAK